MREKLIAAIRDLNPLVFTGLAVLISLVLVTTLNFLFFWLDGGGFDPRVFILILLEATLLPLVIAPFMIQMFKSVSVLKQTNQQLQGQVEQHLQARQGAEERFANLQAVSNFAIACATAGPEADLHKLIADQLQELTGALGVAISEYDAREKALITRHVTAPGPALSLLNNLIGHNIIGLRSPVSEQTYQRMLNSVVEVAPGLHEVSFGAIPKAVSAVVQATFGLGDFVGLAFIYGGELWGAGMIVMRNHQPPLNPDLAMTFANVAAVALRRQKTEEALQASEERYRRIVSVISDYSYSAVVDAQGHYSPEWVAGAFARITGYQFDEYLSCGGWENLLHPDSAPQDQLDRANLQANQPIEGSILKIIRKDGEIRWVRNFAYPVWNQPENRLAGVYGGVQDITAEKLASSRLQALNAELEQRVAERTTRLENALTELKLFSYSISHDLRAPLRAVSGYAGILLAEQRESLTPELAEKLLLIKQNGVRMGQLIDGLLEFLQSGDEPIERQPLEPATIVQGVLERLQPQMEHRQMEIVLGDLPPCMANLRLLDKVYDGLLSNAIKFTRSRAIARIEIGALQENDRPVYFVRDNGVGFEMKYYDKLFGVFQRLHHLSEFDGIGASLAIVQRIINRHGGRIWAEAEPDQGAVFYFTLE